MEVVVVVIFAVFAVLMAIYQGRRHERRIREKIHSLGGEVIGIERKLFSSGPFLVIGRGRTVYRFEYIKDDEVKEGWVKFGDLLGPDWRL